MPFPLSYLIFNTSSKKTVLLIPDHESQETAHFLLVYSWGCSGLLAGSKASNHIYMECTSLSALHIYSLSYVGVFTCMCSVFSSASRVSSHTESPRWTRPDNQAEAVILTRGPKAITDSGFPAFRLASRQRRTRLKSSHANSEMSSICRNTWKFPRLLVQIPYSTLVKGATMWGVCWLHGLLQGENHKHN